jgi:hypothetical protein
VILVLESAADLVNALDEAIVSNRSFAPHGVDQLVFRDDSVWIVKEVAKGRESLGPHRHDHAVRAT